MKDEWVELSTCLRACEDPEFDFVCLSDTSQAGLAKNLWLTKDEVNKFANFLEDIGWLYHDASTKTHEGSRS